MFTAILVSMAGIGVLFIILWAAAMLLRLPELADVGWSISLVLLSLLYYIQFGAHSLRSYLLLAATLLWGIRLSTLLITRLVSGRGDRRYRKLEEAYGEHYLQRYFLFYLVQAATAMILSIPFALAYSAESEFRWSDLLGIILCFGGLFGEWQADAVMARFRRNPQNIGKVCVEGMWRFSRHPNLFFDWIQWVGFACFALASSYWPLALIAPALMLYLMLYVTGIPPTEELLLADKGEVYRAYQRSTSAFFPMSSKTVR